MNEFVIKLDLSDHKAMQKVMITVASLSGDIDYISFDKKGQKLRVIGTMDSVAVVNALRKIEVRNNLSANIISAKQVKKPEKKEVPKKDRSKKEEEAKKKVPKKEEVKKEEPKKKNEKNK